MRIFIFLSFLLVSFSQASLAQIECDALPCWKQALINICQHQSPTQKNFVFWVVDRSNDFHEPLFVQFSLHQTESGEWFFSTFGNEITDLVIEDATAYSIFKSFVRQKKKEEKKEEKLEFHFVLKKLDKTLSNQYFARVYYRLPSATRIIGNIYIVVI